MSGAARPQTQWAPGWTMRNSGPMAEEVPACRSGRTKALGLENNRSTRSTIS